jgi:hypothetical protein
MAMICRAVCCVLALLVSSGISHAQDLTSDPDNVRLEVGDVRRFASVLRGAADGDRALAIERDYLAQASPGLRRYETEYQLTGAESSLPSADNQTRTPTWIERPTRFSGRTRRFAARSGSSKSYSRPRSSLRFGSWLVNSSRVG